MTKSGFICRAAALIISMLPMSAGAALPHANDSVPRPEDRVLLYNNGDMGSKFWRIPALATTNSGTVIAAADKRNASNRDLPNEIDVVIRKSDDSGRTWTPHQMVLKADQGGGYGDPAIGVHRPSGDLVIVAAHGNGLWESTADDHQRVVVTRSADNGVNWSEPVDITYQLYDPKPGAAPIQAYSGFASSGTMLCDESGRLWFMLVARTDSTKWSPLTCFACYSDDAGHTWNVNPTPVDLNGDESKIAQLSDGTFYASIRNRARGERRVSRSADGVNWTPIELQSELVDPACNGDLIALTPAQVEELGLTQYVGDKGLLIHSLANHPTNREKVSIFTSSDLGYSWVKRFIVAPFGSSYSALTLLPDGKLGCLTEENSTEGGFRLWFTRIDMNDWFHKE